MTSEGEELLFRERIVSVLPIEFLNTNQALLISVTATHLDVRWDGSISGPMAVNAPKIGFLSPAFGIHEPLEALTDLRERRLPIFQFMLELLRPTQGLGFTGEWKYRLRGVRSGVSLGSRRGSRVWIASRRSQELVSVILAGGGSAPV